MIRFTPYTKSARRTAWGLRWIIWSWNGSAEEALAQIDGKEYLLPWHGSGKKLFKVGVSFDYEKRNIKEWLVGEE